MTNIIIYKNWIIWRKPYFYVLKSIYLAKYRTYEEIYKITIYVENVIFFNNIEQKKLDFPNHLRTIYENVECIDEK